MTYTTSDFDGDLFDTEIEAHRINDQRDAAEDAYEAAMQARFENWMAS